MPPERFDVAVHELQQLLHGYRHGHEQLAASIKLPARDADTVTRLSDLSGNLSGAPKFESYLTTYPLPSGRYYAVARTWPDTAAPRAGCVLTHTLLVPAQLWMAAPDPRVFDHAFRLPSRGSISQYGSRVGVPKRAVNRTNQPSPTPNDSSLLVFLQKYFVEGHRPIVWFGQRQPEEILWHLLRGLWPKLRLSFSACTFCLQPRTLDDRLFELMFAPPSAYSRFVKIKPENFIDASSTAPVETQEDWVRQWSTRLFGEDSETAPAGESDLWAELEDDPTAIRRLFLIEGLLNTRDVEPQMLVGAMDLVESIARDSDTAAESKRHVAERAVKSARVASNAETGLECLRLIEDRLRRSSFLSVQNSVGRDLVDAVASYTVKFPEITLASSVWSSAGADLKESWFGRGTLEGLRTLARSQPGRLLTLRDVPSLADRFLVADQEVAAAFVSAVARTDDSYARADLLKWLASLKDQEFRSALRRTVLPALESSDTDIAYELLKDLRGAEVGFVLDVLCSKTPGLETSRVRELVLDRISRGHPNETRTWARTVPSWALGVADVFAATYPSTRHGLLELLDANGGLPAVHKAEATAAFMRSLGSGGYPYWFREAARENTALISTLLDGVDSSRVSDQLQTLLTAVPDLPIARSPELLQKVLGCSQSPLFPRLRDVSMRSLIACYVSGVVVEAIARPFQEHEAVAPWFGSVEIRDLRSIVTGDTWASDLHWFNAWQWTSVAPTTLYAREPTPLLSVIDSLSRSHYSGWTESIAGMWSQILRRCKTESRHETTRLSLYVQALKFSFENNRFPLAAVAAEAFPDVYCAVTESDVLPPEVGPLFSMFDWDKGKQLRRALVDCFYHSHWPPGDLVLAAGDVPLLRKVFKRLIKKRNGEEYARAAVADLERRTDAKAAILLDGLRGMLAQPDFYEEWD